MRTRAGILLWLGLVAVGLTGCAAWPMLGTAIGIGVGVMEIISRLGAKVERTVVAPPQAVEAAARRVFHRLELPLETEGRNENTIRLKTAGPEPAITVVLTAMTPRLTTVEIRAGHGLVRARALAEGILEALAREVASTAPGPSAREDQTPETMEVQAEPSPSEDPEARYQAALAAYVAGAFDQALEPLTRLLHQCPGAPRCAGALFWLGEVHRERGNRQAALEAYRRLLEEAPESPEAPRALYRAQALYRADGQIARAEAAARTLLTRFPRTWEARVLRNGDAGWPGGSSGRQPAPSKPQHGGPYQNDPSVDDWYRRVSAGGTALRRRQAWERRNQAPGGP